MGYDVVVKNGRIIDPSRGIDSKGDLHVSGGRVVLPAEGTDSGKPGLVIDVEGCIVTPGLIDFHTHIFHGGSELGVPPDLSLIPNGITTAVDAGTAGFDIYEAFYKSTVSNSVTRIKSFVNVSPAGQITSRYAECIDPQYFDIGKLKYLFEKYKGEIIGLKIRLCRKTAGEMGIKPLEGAIKLAEELGCPIVIHPTDPPVETDLIVNLLRRGDIFVHMFHGVGSTILDDSMKVKKPVREARKRGVLFDSGEGRFNFSFKTARAAVEDSFLPDIVSSDINAFAIYRQPVVSLPNVISKYLGIGMDLNTILAGCTCNPARVLNMQDSIGTLKPGAFADIAIFRLVDQKAVFTDFEGTAVEGTKLFVPMATLKSGVLMYRRLDF